MACTRKNRSLGRGRVVSIEKEKEHRPDRQGWHQKTTLGLHYRRSSSPRRHATVSATSPYKLYAGVNDTERCCYCLAQRVVPVADLRKDAYQPVHEQPGDAQVQDLKDTTARISTHAAR